MSLNYEVRKLHGQGNQRVSKGLTIPSKFLKELNIDENDYVKIFLGLDEKGERKIWIEKLQE